MLLHINSNVNTIYTEAIVKYLVSCILYTGMCRWPGYGFWPCCLKQGIHFTRNCLKQARQFR